MKRLMAVAAMLFMMPVAASADRLEKCYVQNAVGPRHTIVATCFMMDRVKD